MVEIFRERLKVDLIMGGYFFRLYSGHDKVEDVFYSRKNFARPELQRSPHR